ncbi:hypothetical protein [Nocardia bovistercoris]|uniref:Uncharacterized protein n=1 Tax=Nocardia bovistercoris TaxID=2785916 RepID=A0A931IF94_9NOCA|nr:hypothetical protein [Nocardia bovistercoris]MBH0780191.1 hypothetical protein [Nocardia bovistercoris]
MFELVVFGALEQGGDFFEADRGDRAAGGFGPREQTVAGDATPDDFEESQDDEQARETRKRHGHDHTHVSHGTRRSRGFAARGGVPAELRRWYSRLAENGHRMRLLSGGDMPILDRVPNPAHRRNAARTVADRDSASLCTLTASTVRARLLVVARRSGV